MDYLYEDTDKLFSYSTRQQVEIKDRWLGLTFRGLQVLFVTYLVLYVFLWEKGYLAVEQARGAIATHVMGDVVVSSSGKPGTRFFSAEESTYPGLENGNVFIKTRQTSQHQKRGICEDVQMFCESDMDCTVSAGGRCSANGLCEEPSWCNVDNTPEVYNIDNNDLTIWVKSSIQFIQLAPRQIFTTETDHPYAELGFNAFKLKDLMMLCEPLPVRFEEVSELGAAIEVQFVWDCNVEEDCGGKGPVIRAKRIDTIFDPDHIGFGFAYATHLSRDERILNQVKGIRVWFRTVGVGKKVSIRTIVMKASTGMALLALAPIVADQIMLKCTRNRLKFLARKYEYSPDFSAHKQQMNEQIQAANALPGAHKMADEKYKEEEKDWLRRLDEED